MYCLLKHYCKILNNTKVTPITCDKNNNHPTFYIKEYFIESIFNCFSRFIVKKKKLIEIIYIIIKKYIIIIIVSLTHKYCMNTQCNIVIICLIYSN